LLDRKEAISLFTELVAHGLVTPSLVVIEQRKPDKYQLKIKGDYDFLLIFKFVKSKNLMAEEDTAKECIRVFKP
jgi:hypothetical protein